MKSVAIQCGCAPQKVSICKAPFSHEPEALRIKEECDYSQKMSFKDAQSGLGSRKVRVYADGIYDMFHSGHARQLMQAKTAFPNCYLIVGVCNDELTHKMKGKTVMNDVERYEAVRHCRYVDEVFCNAPWSYGLEFLHENKIDFVAHDDIPYGAAGTEDVYKDIKAAGMFLPTLRTEGVSTTDVIARIVKDYDGYVRRNLSRGLSRQELNISFMKEKEIIFSEKFRNLKRKSSSFFHNIDSKRRELLDKWDDKSHEMVSSFLDFFSKDGVKKWVRAKRAAVAKAISPVPEYYDESERGGSSNNDSSRYSTSRIAHTDHYFMDSGATGSSTHYSDDDEYSYESDDPKSDWLPISPPRKRRRSRSVSE